MTAKEALQVLIDNLEYPCDEEYDIIWNALNRLEELEKVLKIIKEKKVNIFYLMLYQSYYEYNDKFDRDLTETEFNKLKEYLK